MQVFKCAMRIVRANILLPVIYIISLSFMGVIIASTLDIGAYSDDFERVDFSYAVIDRDGSALSQGAEEVLAAGGTRVDIADDGFAIQDAVAKGRVNYLVVIPEGFGDAFEEAARSGDAVPDVDVVYSFYALEGALVDERMNGYLSLARSLFAAEPDAQAKSVAEKAVSLSSAQVQTEVIAGTSQVGEAYRLVFYLRWSTYTLFCGIVVCIGMLITTMNRADVRRRNLASPLPFFSYNCQLALACIVFVAVAAAWSILLGALAFPQAVEHITGAGLALCSVSVLCYSLMAAAFGFLLGSFGTGSTMCNALGNIFGLIISFMSGAWISLEYMSPQVMAIAYWLPGYWYSSAIEASVDIGSQGSVAGGADLTAFLQGDGILLLFGLALFCVALLVARMRTQTSDAGGNRPSA